MKTKYFTIFLTLLLLSFAQVGWAEEEYFDATSFNAGPMGGIGDSYVPESIQPSIPTAQIVTNEFGEQTSLKYNNDGTVFFQDSNQIGVIGNQGSLTTVPNLNQNIMPWEQVSITPQNISGVGSSFDVQYTSAEGFPVRNTVQENLGSSTAPAPAVSEGYEGSMATSTLDSNLSREDFKVYKDALGNVEHKETITKDGTEVRFSDGSGYLVKDGSFIRNLTSGKEQFSGDRSLAVPTVAPVDSKDYNMKINNMDINVTALSDGKVQVTRVKDGQKEEGSIFNYPFGNGSAVRFGDEVVPIPEKTQADMYGKLYNINAEQSKEVKHTWFGGEKAYVETYLKPQSSIAPQVAAETIKPAQAVVPGVGDVVASNNAELQKQRIFDDSGQPGLASYKGALVAEGAPYTAATGEKIIFKQVPIGDSGDNGTRLEAYVERDGKFTKADNVRSTLGFVTVDLGEAGTVSPYFDRDTSKKIMTELFPKDQYGSQRDITDPKIVDGRLKFDNYLKTNVQELTATGKIGDQDVLVKIRPEANGSLTVIYNGKEGAFRNDFSGNPAGYILRGGNSNNLDEYAPPDINIAFSKEEVNNIYKVLYGLENGNDYVHYTTFSAKPYMEVSRGPSIGVKEESVKAALPPAVDQGGAAINLKEALQQGIGKDVVVPPAEGGVAAFVVDKPAQDGASDTQAGLTKPGKIIEIDITQELKAEMAQRKQEQAQVLTAQITQADNKIQELSNLISKFENYDDKKLERNNAKEAQQNTLTQLKSQLVEVQAAKSQAEAAIFQLGLPNSGKEPTLTEPAQQINPAGTKDKLREEILRIDSKIDDLNGKIEEARKNYNDPNDPLREKLNASLAPLKTSLSQAQSERLNKVADYVIPDNKITPPLRGEPEAPQRKLPIEIGTFEEGVYRVVPPKQEESVAKNHPPERYEGPIPTDEGFKMPEKAYAPVNLERQAKNERDLEKSVRDLRNSETSLVGSETAGRIQEALRAGEAMKKDKVVVDASQVASNIAGGALGAQANANKEGLMTMQVGGEKVYLPQDMSVFYEGKKDLKMEKYTEAGKEYFKITDPKGNEERGTTHIGTLGANNIFQPLESRFPTETPGVIQVNKGSERYFINESGERLDPRQVDDIIANHASGA